MIWLQVSWLELCALAREAIPGRGWRWAIGLTFAGVGLLSILAAITLGLSGPRRSVGLGSLQGMLIVLFVLATATVMGSLSHYLREPQAGRLARLVPRSRSFLPTAHLAAAGSVAVVALAVLYLPVLTLVFMSGLGQGLLLLGVGIAIGGCAIAAGGALVLGIASTLGRLAAAKASVVLSGLVIVLGVSVLQAFTLWNIPSRGLALFLVVMSGLLPWSLRAIATRFSRVLDRADPAEESSEPPWGRDIWWILIWRTPAPWAWAGLAIVVSALIISTNPGKWSAAAFAIVTVGAAPLGQLLEAERKCASRWRLASRPSAVHVSTWDI